MVRVGSATPSTTACGHGVQRCCPETTSYVSLLSSPAVKKTFLGLRLAEYPLERHSNVVFKQPCCKKDIFGSPVSGMHPWKDIPMSFPESEPGFDTNCGSLQGHNCPVPPRRKGADTFPAPAPTPLESHRPLVDSHGSVPKSISAAKTPSNG